MKFFRKCVYSFVALLEAPSEKNRLCICFFVAPLEACLEKY